MINNAETHDSLYKLADTLVFETNKIISHAKTTEEDLRIGFEKLL